MNETVTIIADNGNKYLVEYSSENSVSYRFIIVLDLPHNKIRISKSSYKKFHERYFKKFVEGKYYPTWCVYNEQVYLTALKKYERKKKLRKLLS